MNERRGLRYVYKTKSRRSYVEGKVCHLSKVDVQRRNNDNKNGVL